MRAQFTRLFGVDSQGKDGKTEVICAVLILLAFVIFSIPRLSLPFFWDASWVYAPAIYEMSQGIPSLLPDSIPTHIGRGHPLMFHFLVACWVKFFGFSPLVLNIFVLLISVGVLWTVYLLGSRFFGHGAGLIALAICATQEIFVTQALQVLPEMLLSLFVLTTIYTFLRELHILFILSGIGLLLTKETGIVVIIALGLVHILKVLYATERSQRVKKFWTGAGILALPVCVASLHYVYQKIVFGWFFFPEHVESQIWNVVPIMYRMRDVFDLIFMWQGRQFITIPVLIGLAFWFGRKKIWPGIVLLAVLVLMHQVFYRGFGLTAWIRLVVPALCLVGIVLFTLIPYLRKDARSGLAANALVIYLALFMAFTSINLLTARYVLNAIPVFALLCGWIVSRYTTKKWMYLPVLGLLIGSFVYQLSQPRDVRDINLTYADGVKIYQAFVEYFSNETEKPCTVMGTLLEAVAMGDPRTCYIETPVKDVTVVIQRDTMKLIEGSVDYLINTNILEYVNLPKSDPACCTLVKEFQIGQAKAEIYRIKKD